MAKIDVDKLEITPALFGICEKLPLETIRKLFQETLEVLNEKEEEPIYGRAMATYAWARYHGANFYNGKDEFKRLIQDLDAIKFGNELIPDAIFEPYWELAKDRKLWVEKYVLGKHIPYDQALKIWMEERADDIEAIRENLQVWLNNQEI